MLILECSSTNLTVKDATIHRARLFLMKLQQDVCNKLNAGIDWKRNNNKVPTQDISNRNRLININSLNWSGWSVEAAMIDRGKPLRPTLLNNVRLMPLVTVRLDLLLELTFCHPLIFTANNKTSGVLMSVVEQWCRIAIDGMKRANFICHHLLLPQFSGCALNRLVLHLLTRRTTNMKQSNRSNTYLASESKTKIDQLKINKQKCGGK